MEIQASIIIGSGSLSYEIMKNLVERLPVMVTPKWVSSLAQPIWINDVISYLIESIELKSMNSCVIQIGGPDQVTYKELMSIYAKILGKKNIRVNLIQPGWIMTKKQLEKWINKESELLIEKNQLLIG